MTVIDDAGTVARAARLRKLMSEFLRDRSSPARDRSMQEYLAQARGAAANAVALRRLMDFAIRIRRTRQRDGGARG